MLEHVKSPSTNIRLKKASVASAAYMDAKVTRSTAINGHHTYFLTGGVEPAVPCECLDITLFLS